MWTETRERKAWTERGAARTLDAVPQFTAGWQEKTLMDTLLLHHQPAGQLCQSWPPSQSHLLPGIMIRMYNEARPRSISTALHARASLPLRCCSAAATIDAQCLCCLCSPSNFSLSWMPEHFNLSLQHGVAVEAKSKSQANTGSGVPSSQELHPH